MAPVVQADYTVNTDGLRELLLQYAHESGGYFRATLVRENGQRYNLVLHQGGATPKTRVYLNDSGSLTVSDILEELFTEGGAYAPTTKEIVHRTLTSDYGSVMLVIERNIVAASHFHNGELWP